MTRDGKGSWNQASKYIVEGSIHNLGHLLLAFSVSNGDPHLRVAAIRMMHKPVDPLLRCDLSASADRTPSQVVSADE